MRGNIVFVEFRRRRGRVLINVHTTQAVRIRQADYYAQLTSTTLRAHGGLSLRLSMLLMSASAQILGNLCAVTVDGLAGVMVFAPPFLVMPVHS